MTVDAAVWAVRLDRRLTAREEERLLAAASPGRREQLLRLRREEQRQQALCAELVLRAALWMRCGWRSLPAVARTDRGKPYFPDWPEVCFNLSHTDGAVLAGVADCPVGVDIERIRPPGRHLLRRMGADLSPEAFFQTWVRREARAKCSGEGVRALLGPEPAWAPGERYQPVETFPGYAAGVAVRGAELPAPPRLLCLELLLRLAEALSENPEE